MSFSFYLYHLSILEFPSFTPVFQLHQYLYEFLFAVAFLNSPNNLSVGFTFLTIKVVVYKWINFSLHIRTFGLWTWCHYPKYLCSGYSGIVYYLSRAQIKVRRFIKGKLCLYTIYWELEKNRMRGQISTSSSQQDKRDIGIELEDGGMTILGREKFVGCQFIVRDLKGDS